MTRYNCLNVKLSKPQLNKLKSGISGKAFANNSSANIKLLKTQLVPDTQVSRTRKAFANNSAANIKLLKFWLSKIVQLGGFLGRLLGALLKAGLHLMKNVLKPLVKSVLVPLGLTAAASASDAAL